MKKKLYGAEIENEQGIFSRKIEKITKPYAA
jgi:hypothetical protein